MKIKDTKTESKIETWLPRNFLETSASRIAQFCSHAAHTSREEEEQDDHEHDDGKRDVLRRRGSTQAEYARVRMQRPGRARVRTRLLRALGLVKPPTRVRAAVLARARTCEGAAYPHRRTSDPMVMAYE